MAGTTKMAARRRLMPSSPQMLGIPCRRHARIAKNAHGIANRLKRNNDLTPSEGRDPTICAYLKSGHSFKYPNTGYISAVTTLAMSIAITGTKQATIHNSVAGTVLDSVLIRQLNVIWAGFSAKNASRPEALGVPFIPSTLRPCRWNVKAPKARWLRVVGGW